MSDADDRTAASAAAAFAVLCQRGLLTHITRFQSGVPQEIFALERELGLLTLPAYFNSLFPRSWTKPLRHAPLRIIQWLCGVCRLNEHSRFSANFKPKLKEDAAYYGRLDVLQWLDESEDPMGGPWSPECLHHACSQQQFAAAQWLVDRHPESCSANNLECLAAAATHGDLQLLQTLIAHFPDSLTPLVMDAALGARQWDVIHHLHDETSCGCTAAAMDTAAELGHMDVVRFLHEHRLEGCTTKAMDAAATRGDLEMVRFLHDNRSEGCTTRALEKAAVNGHLDAVRFLQEHCVDRVCTNQALYEAALSPHIEVVRYLCENPCRGLPSCSHDEFIDLSRLLNHSFDFPCVEVVQYLYDHCSARCSTVDTHWSVMRSKDLELVRFVHERMGHPLTDYALSRALESAIPEMVEYVLDRTDRGCVYDAEIQAKYYLQHFDSAAARLRELRARMDPDVRWCSPRLHSEGTRGPGCRTVEPENDAHPA